MRTNRLVFQAAVIFFAGLLVFILGMVFEPKMPDILKVAIWLITKTAFMLAGAYAMMALNLKWRHVFFLLVATSLMLIALSADSLFLLTDPHRMERAVRVIFVVCIPTLFFLSGAVFTLYGSGKK